MTKAQFNAKVLEYWKKKEELDKLKEEIKKYMIDNSTIDEVIKPMEDGRELAVTYSDGYISERLDSKKVRAIFTEMGMAVPVMEVTVTEALSVKVRKIKK